jgi:signal peptidase I
MNDCRRATATALIAEAVRTRGSARFRVQGGSMRPLVRGGDVLEVRRAELATLRTGDIAVFARAGGLFAHRVIGRAQRGGEAVLITKGDAFPEPDAPVCAEELLGRVAVVLRGPRRMALDSAGRRAAGKLVARLSAAAPSWYPAARAVMRALARAW